MFHFSLFLAEMGFCTVAILDVVHVMACFCKIYPTVFFEHSVIDKQILTSSMQIKLLFYP